jgi:hypothetical protein
MVLREREREKEKRERGKERERERETEAMLSRERNFPLTFDNNSSKMTTHNFLRSVRSHRKIEIFDFVEIPPISKSHKLYHMAPMPLLYP